MAVSCRRIYYKYFKCIIISVLIAFFIQLYIALNLFPSESSSSTSLHVISEDNSERKAAQNYDEDVMRNSKNHSFYLRVEELDFKPICKVKSREAISAIHRAKSQKCKQEIVNKTCLIQDGMFYPKVLRNYCLSQDKRLGKYVGCFLDRKNKRLLTSLYGNYANSNTPRTCMDICLQAGLPYAGVQYGTECFCGDTLPEPKSETEEGGCNMQCSGDSTRTCGGYFTMNIYETGLNKFTAVTPRTDKGDKAVKIVFLLTLNGRALRQVYRLINAIYKTSHYIYIHVDNRQDYMFRKLLELEKRFPNIKLATKRYSTIWGGASLLRMLLSSMQEFFHLGWTWDFVINLSESDFPIKSLDTLEEFLSANKNLNFVKSQGRDIQRFIKKQGLDKTFIECDTHMWRVGDRKLPRGIVMDGGSDWIALSYSFVKYVIEEQDDLLKGLAIVFEHTLLPAESFFHTVLRNSVFCNTYVDNNLHVTNWKRKLGCKCQYKHVVDWCGCSPNDFRIEDWARIQMTQERQLFFARKFEPIINQEIITKVENLIGFEDHDQIENLEAYWQSIYDSKDLTAATDDVLVTHASSIARLNAKILVEEECVIEPIEILEINSYSLFDTFKGNLVLHKALLQNSKEVTIETWYKVENTLALNENSQYFEAIRMFEVSSDYDQKEVMFRNLANILGPLSSPTLLYQFSPSTNLGDHLTVIWLDPGGIIADINTIHVNENNLTNFIVPHLKTPLLPGIWKVGLLKNTDVVAVTSFLISPLEYFLGKEMTQQEANIIHSGSQNSYKVFSDIDPNIFIPSQDDKILLQRDSFSNGKRLGKDLEEWIDNLNTVFYTVLNTCITSSKSNVKDDFVCGKHKFDICESTEWSSLSPDPKGSIGVLNKVTGRLDRH